MADARMEDLIRSQDNRLLKLKQERQQYLDMQGEEEHAEPVATLVRPRSPA